MTRAILVVTALTAFCSRGFAADGPIPQDVAQMQKRRQERLAWYRRTTLDVYEKIGKKNQRWDANARKALELAALVANPQDGPPVTLADAEKALKAAIDAGCDDPFIVVFYQRTLGGNRDAAAIRRLEDSAKVLAKSKYPAFRRASALEAAGAASLAVQTVDDATKKKAMEHFDACLNLLPESAASDERNEFWEDSWIDIMSRLFRSYHRLGIEPVAANAKIDSVMLKLRDLQPLRYTMHGIFLFSYAWDARSTAPAQQVGAGQFDKFHERLEAAKVEFQKAWELRHDGRLAHYFLSIDQALENNREVMEYWFDQAMKANGDDFEACWGKLDWLDPKWRGTSEEMLAFGHRCAETKNWQAKIILLAADAHLRHCESFANADMRRNYLSTPAVWTEIKSVFDEHLKHFPTDYTARSKYAFMCYTAGKYFEAEEQFQIIGDRLTPWSDGTRVSMEILQRVRTFSRGRARGARPGTMPPGPTSGTPVKP